MKIEQVLTTPSEIEQFLSNLWQSPEFKQSFDSNGFIREVCEPFLHYPRLVVSMTENNVEYSQFFSWFNCLCIRKYDNPYVQDLYYLHEIVHISTMIYDADLNFSEWKKKMGDNEELASIISEALVYFHLPVREKTFPFPIWVDRHLEKEAFDVERGISLRTHSKFNPVDEVEHELSKYNRQNEAWYQIWESRFSKVEKNMAKFYQTKDVNELTNFLDKFSANGIPFWKEAFLFSIVYKQTKASK